MKCWSIAVLLLAAVLAEKALARPGDAAENEDGFQDDDAGPGPDQGAEDGAAPAPGPAPAVPKLLSAPLRITPRPGDTVVLPCVVENPSTVIWLNGSCTLYLGVRRLCVPNDTRISLHEDHSLEIQNVQPHDSGDYVCKLSGSLLLTHHINVFEAGSGAQAGSGAPVERISFGLLLGAVAFFLTRS